MKSLRQVAGAIVVVALAGCGAVRAAQPGSGSRQQAGPGHQVAAHGSRAQAAALGRRMLARLVLPRGSAPLSARPLPRGLRQPGELMGYGAYSVDLHKVFALTPSMAAAQAFVAGHVPAGMTSSGTGSSDGPSGPLADFVSFGWRKLPGGIYLADLVVAIVPAARGGGSALRADAQVMWYPARSAAEFVRPDRFRAVTVAVTRYGRTARTARRTFTARSIIAKLARLFNGLPAEPSVTFHCPLISTSYQVTFVPASNGQAPVVVRPTGCMAVLVTVGGRAQPALFGDVTSAIDRLLSR